MTSPQLKLAPDLRKALEQLPKPNSAPTVRVTIEVAAEDLAASAVGAGARRRTVPMVVEFHRGILATAEGNEPVWVFEGPLALDAAATPAEHAPGIVAEWLREQLGPRCLAVDVSDVDEHEAKVRIAATVGGVGRPD